jgi:AcrR family transcriptional regulator
MEALTETDAEGLWEAVQPGGSRRVLLAALEIFSAHGYNASTTREIARRAGMSPAAVYVHYRSKADLLSAMSRTGHAAVLADVRESLVGVEDPVDRLHGLMSTFVAWHARNHTLARVIQYELLELPPDAFAEIRSLRRKFERLLRSELERGIDSGDFHIADLRSTELALLSMGIDVARWWTPQFPTPEHLGANYADLALRMLGAERVAAHS